MKIRMLSGRLAAAVLLFACVSALPAQTTFLQMTDPQFGFFTNNKAIDQEVANLEFAIASANRLKPAFVVMTGDLIHKAGDAEQIAAYKRIVGKLDPSIKLYAIPGNHDFSEPVTRESLAQYRAAFGPDYYSFRSGDIAGIMLNSTLMKDPKALPDETAKMEDWCRTELARIRQQGAGRILVFLHHPLFQKTADEPDQSFNVPLAVRSKYVALFKENGVKQAFAGHTHKDSVVRDGDLELIVSGPVGKPLGGESGLTIVKVTADAVTAKYYSLGNLP
jgi:serine/threonine-protein phosphatase CPPED1